MRPETRDVRHETWSPRRTPLFVFWSLVSCLLSPVSLCAGQLPSLFRGVAFADSPDGVRVVSVEDASQAALSDLRPEDILVQVNDRRLAKIDEFAAVSESLRGRAIRATLIVLRNGEPREILVHLYSYPVLRAWDLTFVPEHDIRFADGKVGAEYWTRMARGFLIAGKLEESLNATLNALHNDPAQLDEALRAASLLLDIAQQRLTERRLPESLVALKQATILLNRVFEHPLTTPQLEAIKSRLARTLELMKRYRSPGRELAPSTSVR